LLERGGAVIAAESGTPVDPGAQLPPAGTGAVGTGLLSGAMVVFVGNAVARGLGFLFPLVLARVTGRADFALVYFFVNTGFAVGELVLAGYPTGLTRFVSAYPEARARWATSAVLAGIPLLATSIALGCVLSVQSAAPIAPMVVVVVGLTIDAYYFALLRGLGWFGTLMMYRISANAGQLLVLAVAAWLGVASVGLAVAAYSLLYLAPMLVIEMKRHPLRSVFARGARPSLESVRALTRFSIPALVSGVAYAAIQGLDVYFVRTFASAQLADYGAARSLAMPMQLVPFAMTVVLMPRVASADDHHRVRMLREALGVTLIALVAASLAYVVLAGPLIAVFFPESYRRASELLIFVAPALGLVGLHSVMSQWWMGTGRSLEPAACLSAGAVVAVCGQVTITAHAGAAGAAASIGLGALAAIGLLGLLTVARVRGVNRSLRPHGPTGQRRVS
jgi:O-antigen/teichoic acid export membrane protein